MDSVKARVLLDKIMNKTVGGYRVLSLLDHGKSAAVFMAQKGDYKYALKVFDDELIESYGGEAQFERISREIELKDHPHENLVRIVEGGICPITCNHFIVMEYVKGENLKKCLPEIHPEDIWGYLSQLASAAQHLDNLGYAHRDIKPENIMIDSGSRKLTLMDLGVIKPIQGAPLTDVEGVLPFIGTLQYSSPEYLLREEDDTPEGWRALTFYQIGAVLHDLIMKVPLFEDQCDPYGRLVLAVRNRTPIIECHNVDQDLVHLAQCCLIKIPQQRLEMLKWKNFYKADKPPSAKERVVKKMQLAKLDFKEDDDAWNQQVVRNELEHRVVDVLKTSTRLVLSDDKQILRTTVTSPNDGKVVVLFDAAPSIGLTKGFRLGVELEIINVESEAIRITFSAHESEGSIILDGVVFTGIYNKDGIYQGYENAIYESINFMIQAVGHG